MAYSRGRGWTLAATVLGSCMAFIDGTVVNIAIPVMQRSIGATMSDAQWIVDSYLIVLTSLILVGGSLGDHLGRRRVFAAGVVLFAAASAWCGAAGSAPMLIAARAVQGLGAALLIPGSLAIITDTYPPNERGRAIGTWSSLTSLAVIAGPLLGGWLVQAVSWRAVFYINLPVAVLTLLILWRAIPRGEGERGQRRNPARSHQRSSTESVWASVWSIDWSGSVLVSLALAAITFALIEAPARGLTAPLVIWTGIAGVAILAIFLWHERRIAEPIVPLTLFRSRSFSGANILTFLLYGALSAFTFLVPFNLIQVQGYSPAQAGSAFLPFVVTMSLLSRWTGALADRLGPRLLLTIGPLVTGCGFLTLALLARGHGSYWTMFFPGTLVLGLGMAITVAPLTTTVMTSIDNESEAGAASGINNTISRAAGLLAIALFGTLSIVLFARDLDNRLGRAGESVAVRHAMVAQRLALADARPPANLPPQKRSQIETAVDDAFVHAFRVSMLLAGVLAIVSAAGGLLTVSKRAHPDSDRVSS
jgi:EmrB/QacA subfamily drug resistance transporter